VEDLRLLRQLWSIIDPTSPIGEDTPENRYVKGEEAKREVARIEKEKKKMMSKLTKLRMIGRLDKLTRHDIIFIREHKLAGVESLRT
jgi:histidinol-phosphate/aromatic aminotransferase/cobyric acid decarboxylase-like protein